MSGMGLKKQRNAEIWTVIVGAYLEIDFDDAQDFVDVGPDSGFGEAQEIAGDDLVFDFDKFQGFDFDESPGIASACRDLDYNVLVIDGDQVHDDDQDFDDDVRDFEVASNVVYLIQAETRNDGLDGQNMVVEHCQFVSPGDVRFSGLGATQWISSASLVYFGMRRRPQLAAVVGSSDIVHCSLLPLPPLPGAPPICFPGCWKRDHRRAVCRCKQKQDHTAKTPNPWSRGSV